MLCADQPALLNSCDYPSCLYWKEQLEAFPDAMVVHSTRSADSWADSALDTILNVQGDNPRQPWGIWLLQHLFPFKVGRPMARMTRSVVSPQLGGDYSKQHLIKAFKDWEASVVRDCPKDKLLIFQAKDGWAPLCAHLKLPIPDVPFPNVNDTAEFKRILVVMSVLGWLTAALYGYGLAKAVEVGLRLWK